MAACSRLLWTACQTCRRAASSSTVRKERCLIPTRDFPPAGHQQLPVILADLRNSRRRRCASAASFSSQAQTNVLLSDKAKSDDDVWRHQTQRLLQSSDSWSDATWLLAKETLQWWVCQRPVTAETVQNAFAVLNAMLEKEELKVTRKDLRSVLDHWRIAVEDGLTLGQEFSPLAVFRLLRSLSPSLADVLIYTRIVTGMIYDPDSSPMDAERVLQYVLRETDVEPNAHLFTSVITAWAKSGQSQAGEQAQRLFQALRDSGLQPDKVTYGALLEAWVNSKHPDAPDRAEQVFAELSESNLAASSGSCLHILQAWSKSDRPEGADRADAILQTMIKRYLSEGSSSSVIPTLQCFSAVQSGYAKRGQPEKTESLLRQQQQLFDQTGDPVFSPSVWTFYTVLDAYANSKEPGSAQRAQELLDLLKQGIRAGDDLIYPNMTCYSAVMRAWACSDCLNAVERSQALFDEVQQLFESGDNGFNPDSQVYTALLSAWARSGRPGAAKGALAILDDMEERYQIDQSNVPPGIFQYSVVISAFARVGDVTNAERLLERMYTGYDVVPNVYCYCAVLDAYANSKEPGSAQQAQKSLDVLKQGVRPGNDTIYPNIACYSTVMAAWARSRSSDAVDRIQVLFNEVQQRFDAGDEGFKPSSQMRTTLLSAWAKSGRPGAAQRALSILDEMEERHRFNPLNDPPDSFQYSAVISAFARVGDVANAEKLFERMNVNRDVVPCIGCYNALLDAYANSKEPGSAQRAQELLDRLKQGVRAGDDVIYPDIVSYSTVMHAWTRSGSSNAVDHTQALFDEVQQRFEAGDKTFNPNSQVRTSLLSAWARSGRPGAADRALGILDEMEEKHRNDPSSERPDSFQYSVVISAFARVGDVANAERLLERMHTGNDVVPLISCYNAVLDAYAKSGDLNAGERAEELLGALEKGMSVRDGGRKVYADSITYSCAIKVWEARDDPNAFTRALAILHRMIQSSQTPNKRDLVRLESRSFFAVLKVLLTNPVPDKARHAKEISALMKQYRVAPDRYTRRLLQQCHASRD